MQRAATALVDRAIGRFRDPRALMAKRRSVRRLDGHNVGD